MPLYLTSTQTSRVTKSRKPASLQRSSSLPFATSKRTKSLQRANTIASALDADEDDDNPELQGTGKIINVIEVSSIKDVLSALRYARSTMFDPLPERAGMNSVRIAEVLIFQKNLPAVVTVAHVHALRSASSRTEREIQGQLSSNQIRRLKLVGRGNEVSGLSELLISTEEYEKCLLRRTGNGGGVSEEVASAFIAALKEHPKVYALPPGCLRRSHVDVLTRAGFLVSPSLRGSTSSSSNNTLSSSSSSSSRHPQSVVAPSTISRSASGTQAAVGGDSAFEILGGVNGIRRTKSGDIARPSSSNDNTTTTEYVLSHPNLATYLQLLQTARTHLLTLLRQFSPHKQVAPLYLLKERWNGNVDDDNNSVSVARRVRGDFSNVAPAKTKKWRVLNGLAFDWVVEECLGAGLIEVFETKSVGLGIRALG